MKNQILLLLLLFTSSIAVAQADALQNKNEVRLNALYLILGAIEADYEYVLNEESGLGISVFLPIDEDVNINYYIAPYYRFYFGKKPAAGFFFEGFMMLNSTEDDGGDFLIQPIDENSLNVTDLALGIGIGGKFMTKSGFVAEISWGIGRNLLNDEVVYEFVPKGGLKVGYRF